MPMISRIDPNSMEILRDIIQEYIDHKGDEKRPVDKLLEGYGTAIKEGRVAIFVEFDAKENPRGCIFYTKMKSRFSLIFARGDFDVERALFDYAFAIARSELEYLSFDSGYPTPWISEKFSDYVKKYGIEKHDRAFMRLKKGNFSGPTPVPQGINIVPFSDDHIEEVTHVVFRAVENTVDQKLWPNVYGTEEAALGFHRDISSGKWGEHGPRSSWVASSGEKQTGVCFAIVRGNSGAIMHLAVDPDWRRRGIGRALLTKTLKNLFQENEKVCEVTLAVTLSNPAMALYESIGFEVLNNSSSYIWRKIDRNH